MILRFIFVISLLVSFTACERIPEWEVKSGQGSENQKLAGLNQLQNWLWTCRGRQVSFRLGSTASLVGKSVEEFFDQFRSASLSPVEISGDKVILGNSLLLDHRGFLVTQYHWVEQVEDIECRNPNLGWLPAKIQGYDRPLNLAVLQIDLGEKANWFRGDRKWTLREGGFQVDEKLQLIAAPYPGMLDRLEVQMQVTRPVLHTGIDEDLILFLPNTPEVMQGAVLADQDLRLIGLHFGGRSSAWGTAIKLKLVSQIATAIIEKKSVERPYLGLRVRFVQEKGFRVTEVQVGGPAYRAGLRVDDIITQWENQKLLRLDAWPELEIKSIGSDVSLVYQRQGAEVQTQLSIAGLR